MKEKQFNSPAYRSRVKLYSMLVIQHNLRYTGLCVRTGSRVTELIFMHDKQIHMHKRVMCIIYWRTCSFAKPV